ncbi:hypothetical protein [Saccharothrix deserti]|uniref:hypothetical protein n=1 Tax=Saccharothrix deserti TaxID=2593674 RepID=UPI00131CC585|nr:hypothetical protein [Saccharothrix deserti]
MMPTRIPVRLHDPPSRCPACEWPHGQGELKRGRDSQYRCRDCGHEWNPDVPSDAPPICRHCEVNWYVEDSDTRKHRWRCANCHNRWGRGPVPPGMFWCTNCEDYHGYDVECFYEP